MFDHPLPLTPLGLYIKHLYRVLQLVMQVMVLSGEKLFLSQANNRGHQNGDPGVIRVMIRI